VVSLHGGIKTSRLLNESRGSQGERMDTLSRGVGGCYDDDHERGTPGESPPPLQKRCTMLPRESEIEEQDVRPGDLCLLGVLVDGHPLAAGQARQHQW
jgi:hypothetical protein